MIQRNDKLKKALDAMTSGRPIFLAGAAGAGKSMVVQEILKRSGRLRAVLRTAPWDGGQNVSCRKKDRRGYFAPERRKRDEPDNP
jgi:hypothetical protein